MSGNVKSLGLKGYEEIFSTEEERREEQQERVVRLPLTELHYFKGYPAMETEVPFSGQPYHVRDDDPVMLETLASVARRGVASVYPVLPVLTLMVAMKSWQDTAATGQVKCWGLQICHSLFVK